MSAPTPREPAAEARDLAALVEYTDGLERAALVEVLVERHGLPLRRAVGRVQRLPDEAVRGILDDLAVFVAERF